MVLYAIKIVKLIQTVRFDCLTCDSFHVCAKDVNYEERHISDIFTGWKKRKHPRLNDQKGAFSLWA